MILLVLILFLQATQIDIYAVSEQKFYARVLFDQVYFYKTPLENNNSSNVYFELPKTYFVVITGVKDNFYEASYQNLNGYVKKDSVQAVEGTPTNPFLINISFRVYAELSEKIYSLPHSNSSLILELAPLTKNIEYIGKINGETLIDGRTDIWYYCKYKDYYGYVYSDFCDEMQQITNNTEELKYINNPTFSNEIKQVKAIPKDSNAVGIIVGILSVPALIFVLMLVKGTSLFTPHKSKRKEVVDY